MNFFEKIFNLEARRKEKTKEYVEELKRDNAEVFKTEGERQASVKEMGKRIIEKYTLQPWLAHKDAEPIDVYTGEIKVGVEDFRKVLWDIKPDYIKLYSTQTPLEPYARWRLQVDDGIWVAHEPASDKDMLEKLGISGFSEISRGVIEIDWSKAQK